MSKGEKFTLSQSGAIAATGDAGLWPAVAKGRRCTCWTRQQGPSNPDFRRRTFLENSDAQGVLQCCDPFYPGKRRREARGCPQILGENVISGMAGRCCTTQEGSGRGPPIDGSNPASHRSCKDAKDIGRKRTRSNRQSQSRGGSRPGVQPGGVRLV